MAAKVIEIDKNSFEKEVLQAEGPVLVDFWAPWCGPCLIQAPILEEWAAAREGEVKVAKLNTEASPDMATSLGIMSIPTLILFLDGKPVVSAIGVQQADQLDAMLVKATTATV